jgi:hypothetical protein
MRISTCTLLPTQLVIHDAMGLYNIHLLFLRTQNNRDELVLRLVPTSLTSNIYYSTRMDLQGAIYETRTLLSTFLSYSINLKRFLSYGKVETICKL